MNEQHMSSSTFQFVYVFVQCYTCGVFIPLIIINGLPTLGKMETFYGATPAMVTSMLSNVFGIHVNIVHKTNLDIQQRNTQSRCLLFSTLLLVEACEMKCKSAVISLLLTFSQRSGFCNLIYSLG